jgi:hypothetical protein
LAGNVRGVVLELLRTEFDRSSGRWWSRRSPAAAAAAANRGMLGSGELPAGARKLAVRSAPVEARGGPRTVARPRKFVETRLGGCGHGARQRSKGSGRRSYTRGEGRPSFIVNVRAPSRPADGRQWHLGGTRSRTTPVGPRVAARWYGDAEREASSACARAWGRSGLGGRVLGRRARVGTEATARRGATCRTGDV